MTLACPLPSHFFKSINLFHHILVLKFPAMKTFNTFLFSSFASISLSLFMSGASPSPASPAAATTATDINTTHFVLAAPASALYFKSSRHTSFPVHGGAVCYSPLILTIHVLHSFQIFTRLGLCTSVRVRRAVATSANGSVWPVLYGPPYIDSSAVVPTKVVIFFK